MIGTSHRVDAEMGDFLVEFKSGVDATRGLRHAMFQLVMALADTNPSRQALLVLAAPTMTPKRLEEEWRRAARVLRPDLMKRLHLVVFRDGQFNDLPENFDENFRSKLEHAVLAELDRGEVRVPHGEAYHEILKILVNRWMLNRGPMTSDALAKAAGYSYPTVASALRRLGHTIARGAYRSVELARFPKDEWAALVAVSERARSTVRFADRSGQPRTPESLVRRLQSLGRSDVAVGGVLGAKHYYADLDIVGLPRLDITIHSRHGRASLSFLEHLDPALQRSDDPHTPVALAAHFIRRSESLFDQMSEKLYCADPVECLLDLQEARLEPQAKEFLEHFIAQRKEIG